MYEAVATVIDEVEGLTPSETLVLISLAHHKNSNTGLCCPSYELIMMDSRLSRGTVYRTLRELNKKGLIGWVTVGNGTYQKHNEYSLNLNQPSSTVELGSTDQVQLWHRPSSTVTQTKFNCDTDQVQLSNSNKEVNKELNKEENRESTNLSKNGIGIVEKLETITSMWKGTGLKIEKLSAKAEGVAKLFCQDEDYVERFTKVLEGYNNSDWLRTTQNVNSLNWLFGNPSNIEKVVNGNYSNSHKQRITKLNAPQRMKTIEELEASGFRVKKY
jgi:hypothetical protein